jgi:xanthine/uracil/vitamin C permease (AzgA family)
MRVWIDDEPQGRCFFVIAASRRVLLTALQMWAGIVFGGLLTTVLMSFRVKGAIIIGIAIVSILSWP